MPDIAFRANYCESCIVGNLSPCHFYPLTCVIQMRNFVDKGMHSHVFETHPEYKDCIWHLLPYSYQWCAYTFLHLSYVTQEFTQRDTLTSKGNSADSSFLGKLLAGKKK